MSIEIGSKWVKDGEVVDVVSNFHFTLEDEHKKNDGIDLFSGCTVWFFVAEKVSVLTERDFLEKYKPYEPVYEYKYVIGSTEFQKITNKFYKNFEELMNSEDTYGFIGQSFQRLDFTKRERKQ